MSDHPPRRALAVDDEPAILATFRRAFHREIQLVTECNPARGLELFEREPFDLVFVDYSMPGMTGIAFLEGIQRLRLRTRAYLVTAHSTTGEIKEALERGLAKGVIAKPWSRAEILPLLRSDLPVEQRFARASRGGGD